MWQFIAGWLLVHWRWGHLKITPALVDVWQGSETSHSKSSSGNFQHWYLADMLASVYSYHVMVKSVSSCCVRGRRVLSNPVTYVHAYTLYHNRITKIWIHICMYQDLAYPANCTNNIIYKTVVSKILRIIGRKKEFLWRKIRGKKQNKLILSYMMQNYLHIS